MSAFSEVIALLVMVGVAGVVVPVLPGALLILVVIAVWAAVVGGTAWWAFAAAAVCLIGSQVLKYLIPGRALRDAGVPRSTLVAGAVVGVIGFFVIPVVGLVIGFVAGVYGAERRRLSDPRQARVATAGALRAVGVSLVIELGGALLASAIWGVAAVRLT